MREIVLSIIDYDLERQVTSLHTFPNEHSRLDNDEKNKSKKLKTKSQCVKFDHNFVVRRNWIEIQQRSNFKGAESIHFFASPTC